MSKIPVSLQLWSLRDAIQQDFAGTMQSLAQIGFDGVETAGYGNLSAADAARAVAAAGLRCSGMHVGWQVLQSDLPRVMTEARLFGTSDIICPHYPSELLTSAAAFRHLGGELDSLGARLLAHGFTFHYHNHDFELTQIEGRLGLDWLLDASRPAHVRSEVDVYWVHRGGKNPAEFIREQGRRIELLHLKDEAELGSGPVDFPAVFTAAAGIGAVRWHVAEIERFNHAPLESVRRSFDQLRQWTRS